MILNTYLSRSEPHQQIWAEVGKSPILGSGLWMLDFLKDLFFLYPVSSIQYRFSSTCRFARQRP